MTSMWQICQLGSFALCFSSIAGCLVDDFPQLRHQLLLTLSHFLLHVAHPLSQLAVAHLDTMEPPCDSLSSGFCLLAQSFHHSQRLLGGHWALIPDVEDNVWYGSYSFPTDGIRDGLLPRKPKMAVSVQQGKVPEAELSIKSLWGKEKVAGVMNDLRAGTQGSTEHEAGWLDLFSKRYWRVVSVGAALFLFQQFAGINAVVYYSTSVFRSAGVTSDVAASALVGASNVFGTVISSFLMDRQGRKSLLIASFLGMAASMLLLFVSFTWKALASYAGVLAVLGTIMYVLSFSLGAGPVPALLLPEIFASRIRAKAVALSLATHWVSNFVIGLYFLNVVNKYGISNVYLGFSVVCFLAVIYVAGNVVETKGRSLEEIELALSSSA
ncbi:Plastidic glucose transporter 4 [Nymphaea thermarum]|nr:Plastidic glucose transporter 4 [Nymphaea thermarum]